MKEWNILLKFIDCYVYDTDKEEVVITDSPNALLAKGLYDTIIKGYGFEGDKNLKWSFDIALDAIRNLNESDREYLSNNYDVDFHGYGMNIRNRYIHCARLHRYFSADGQSSQVLSFVYTIMHKYYNRFNDELCKLLNDYTYQKTYAMYSKKYPFIEDEVMLLAEGKRKKTADQVLRSIHNKLRQELGRNDFKGIFVSVVKEVGKDCLPPKPWLDLLNKLYDRAPIYKKEYHQVIALKEIGLIRDLVCDAQHNKINTIEECKRVIIDNIGFAEDDAQIMAECMWAAFKEDLSEV